MERPSPRQPVVSAEKRAKAPQFPWRTGLSRFWRPILLLAGLLALGVQPVQAQCPNQSVSVNGLPGGSGRPWEPRAGQGVFASASIEEEKSITRDYQGMTYVVATATKSAAVYANNGGELSAIAAVQVTGESSSPMNYNVEEGAAGQLREFAFMIFDNQGNPPPANLPMPVPLVMEYRVELDGSYTQFDGTTAPGLRGWAFGGVSVGQCDYPGHYATMSCTWSGGSVTSLCTLSDRMGADQDVDDSGLIRFSTSAGYFVVSLLATVVVDTDTLLEFGTGGHAQGQIVVDPFVYIDPSYPYKDQLKVYTYQSPYSNVWVPHVRTVIDGDGDSYLSSVDCNDGDASIHPGAVEACDDGIDNDCDGYVDAADPDCGGNPDADGDGDPDATDCAPNNANVFHGATETCNGVDDNCDGTIDEGISPTPTICGVGACRAAGTLSCQNGQMVNSCNPGLPSAETCNGVDDNCNGTIDDGIPATPTTCGVGACGAAGTLFCQNGQMVNSCTPGLPSAEICNGVDDDCDGATDEGVLATFFRDADGDGFGTAGTSIPACFPPTGYTANSSDCNDANASVHPDAAELCNGIDDNCNGTVDEGVSCDADGDGVPNASDNCKVVPNPTQLDTDGNGLGNACDVPKNKDECKKDGWRSFVSAHFPNQGQCVAFVEASIKGSSR